MLSKQKKCQKIANRRQDDDKSQLRFSEIMDVGEEWSLDTIGPLPADEFGNTYIMVAIDGFSRFVVLEPATDASGESDRVSGEIFAQIGRLVRQTKRDPNRRWVAVRQPSHRCVLPLTRF